MESADTDNGLPGIESSGSAGGLDVHRQIPLKLISKHMSKAKFVSQIPRTKNGIPVLFVGDHIRGSFFMCSTGQECQKTYLSEKTYKLLSTTTIGKLNKKERKKKA
uniref:Hakai C2H2 zinc finger domain-containing protein n=1 Tax=Felis catus TaxID=9685 RepID=A0ABI7VX75_FELCA